MKPIKPIVLKDAKLLSTNEMKNLFGGSSAESGTECTTSCGFARLSMTCAGKCSASPGSGVECVETTTKDGKTTTTTTYQGCNGDSSVLIK